MEKKYYWLFLFFSLLALVLIGADYVCGHMGENPFRPNKCPLCSAFQSAELGHILLFSLLAFGILPVVGFFRLNCLFSTVSVYLTTYSLRAPPSYDNFSK
ncbi:hypothetical protein ACFL5B_00255 [Candidatus Latescibacterota bacterium]